jgi:hypothetical protein
VFPKIKWWTPNFLVGSVALGFITYISNGVTRFSFMSSQFQVSLTYILLVVVLPIVALLVILKRKRDERIA